MAYTLRAPPLLAHSCSAMVRASRRDCTRQTTRWCFVSLRLSDDWYSVICVRNRCWWRAWALKQKQLRTVRRSSTQGSCHRQSKQLPRPTKYEVRRPKHGARQSINIQSLRLALPFVEKSEKRSLGIESLLRYYLKSIKGRPLNKFSPSQLPIRDKIGNIMKLTCNCLTNIEPWLNLLSVSRGGDLDNIRQGHWRWVPWTVFLPRMAFCLPQ